MLTNPKNWTLVSYTNSTWTNLVAEAAVVASVLITNPSASDISCSIRLLTSGAVLLPTTVIKAGESISLEVRSISIPSGDGIQINATAAGLNFIASGAV